MAEITAIKLEEYNKTILSDYDLFTIVWDIYEKRSAKYLRTKFPSKKIYLNLKDILQKKSIIKADRDYKNFWHIMVSGNQPADTVVCQADPYCYISHMSAMHRYGLTDRHPHKLFITSPSDKKAHIWNKSRILNDFPLLDLKDDIFISKLYITHHPKIVRNRPIYQIKTDYFGDWLKIRGSDERIASIGQVFIDMIDKTELCGGIRHVLDIWSEHISKYLDIVIDTIDRSTQPILKVRAGYILDEYLGITDQRILSWLKYTQRGGSRVLEAGRKYTRPFSEKWMISINVD